MTRLFLGACVLTFGLAFGLTGCDGVGTSPGEIESDTTGTSAFRPSPKDSAAIPESFKQVAPGDSLMIPIHAVADEPDSTEGNGQDLQFESAAVSDSAAGVELVELQNGDTLAVLTAADTASDGERAEMDFRPAYGEFVSEETGTLPVTIEASEDGPSPSAQTDPATNVTQTTATLNGTVDPGGAETTVEFAYCETGTTDTTRVNASESPLTGDGEQSVSANVSELDSGTEYGYVVKAQSGEGSDMEEQQTFETK